MADSLLTRWLAHYDPIHHGWTPAGIAAGSVLLAGEGWRGGGRTMLFKGTTRSSIDRNYPVGTAGSDAASIALREGVELAVGTHYFQAVPFGPGGAAAVVDATRPQIVAVVVTDDGLDLLRPAFPRGLRAQAIAAGYIRLTWEFVAMRSRPVPASFAVYCDSGSGTVDYDTPLSTVRARIGRGGEGLYTMASQFADGLAVKFVVRAVTKGGVDDGNVVEATATADAQEPSAGAIDALVLGEDQ